jgi:glycosyltransferase involved in cell wall biosynthesis
VCNVPGEVGDWVRDSGGGVQAGESSGAALAAAIRRLLALAPDERRAMGERGRDWVRREHDRPVLARRLDALLRPLARSAE